MKKSSKLFIIIGLILVIGTLLRTISVTHTTNVFSDTGRDLLVGKKLAEGNAPIGVRPHSSAGVSNTPLYFWIVGFIWKIAGSVEGSVFLHAILSSAMPLLVFFIGRNIVHEKFGLFSALYFAIHPYFVRSSRWIWQPHLLSLFVPLAILAFIKYLSSKNHKKYFLLLFFVAANLAIHLHFSAFLLLIPLMFILTIKSYSDKKYFLLAGLASLGTIVLRVITGFISNSNNTIGNIFNYITINLEEIKKNLTVVQSAFDKSIFLNFYMEPNRIIIIILQLALISYCMWILVKKRKTIEYYLVISLLSVIVTLFFSGFVGEYHFYPYVFLWHFILLLSFYKLWKRKEIIFKLAVGSILISLILIYGKTNYKIINGEKEEITLYKKIAQIIHNDSLLRKSQYNLNESYQLEVVNPIYGPAYSEESKNSIIWLYLENLSSNELITISKIPPVINLTNPNARNTYLVEIKYDNQIQTNTALINNNRKLQSFRHHNTTVDISYFSEK